MKTTANARKLRTAAEGKGRGPGEYPYQFTQVSERHQDCENGENAPPGQPRAGSLPHLGPCPSPRRKPCQPPSNAIRTAGQPLQMTRAARPTSPLALPLVKGCGRTRNIELGTEGSQESQHTTNDRTTADGEDLGGNPVVWASRVEVRVPNRARGGAVTSSDITSLS